MIEWNDWKEIKEYLKDRLKLEIDSTAQEIVLEWKKTIQLLEEHNE